MKYESIPSSKGDFEIQSVEIVEPGAPAAADRLGEDEFQLRMEVVEARKERTRSIMAVSIVVATLVLVLAHGVYSLLMDHEEGASRAIGHLSFLAGTVIGFYFGKKS